MKYYAVKEGRKPGIYKTWEECKAQVHGYKDAKFKKFNNKEDAMAFIGQGENTQTNKFDKIGPKTLYAYVDGSFNKDDRSYSFGAVLLFDLSIKKFSKRFKEDEYSSHRNVSGEIRGAEFAFSYAIDEGFDNLVLYYDYQGIEKWAKKEWKANTELTKNYRDYYDRASKEINIYFEKVLAHSGDEYNEMADMLAKGADFRLKEER